jgi:hypothetical protein
MVLTPLPQGAHDFHRSAVCHHDLLDEQKPQAVPQVTAFKKIILHGENEDILQAFRPLA